MNSVDWSQTAPEAEFVEKLGRLVEEDGGPRISGRVLGLLLLSPGEMPLDEIAERLRVSKASVSTNARMLEQFGIVERTSHPRDRRDFYRVAPDAALRMLERRMQWLHRFGRVVQEGARTAAVAHPEVERRFAGLSRLHRRMIRNAERTLRVLRREAR
jgi:DNA-binding transcriptional regulator GbsR (MarR family)